jgi:hypothetical protein
MTRIAPRVPEWIAALATGALGLIATAMLVGSAVAQERTGDPAKWRSYWTQLYTVFTHPRCLNCHGATDPFSGENHGGGSIDEGEACFGCHTANTTLIAGRCEDGTARFPDDDVLLEDENNPACAPGEEPGEVRVPTGGTWSGGAPPFVGLDMRALCLAVKTTKPPAALLDHVATDTLISFAFEGKRAIADGPFGPVTAEPPPVSREEFTSLLERWITEAAMACSTDGNVVLTDNVTLDSPRSPNGKTQVRNAIDAKVTIERDVATADLRYDEISTLVFTPKAPGCSPVSTGTATFTAEGKPETDYEIQIGPNLTYRMRFLLGPIPGKTEFAYVEVLCRPPQVRGDSSSEPATDLRFGLDEWHTAETDRSKLILRDSTTIPNDDLGAFGFVSGGERKISWDIVIQ